jgi:hypothetical protein
VTASEQEFLERLSEAVKDAVSEALGARDDRPMLTLEQAGARLGGLSDRSMRGMVRGPNPKLASIKVGPSEGSRVVSPAEVDRYLRERELAEERERGDAGQPRSKLTCPVGTNSSSQVARGAGRV